MLDYGLSNHQNVQYPWISRYTVTMYRSLLYCTSVTQGGAEKSETHTFLRKRLASIAMVKQ